MTLPNPTESLMANVYWWANWLFTISLPTEWPTTADGWLIYVPRMVVSGGAFTTMCVLHWICGQPKP